MDASQEADRARVRLRVAARGYDRDEVNACLAENDRRAEHDQARLLDIEAQLTEADHRAKALEAKVAELEHRDDQGPPESVQWLHDVTDQILRVTSDDAHELMIKMENEAKAEKVEAERAVADMLAAAQARAAEIRGAASSDRDAAINMRQESHQQVELYLEESKAMARARARRKEAHLQELTLERIAWRSSGGPFSKTSTTCGAAWRSWSATSDVRVLYGIVGMLHTLLWAAEPRGPAPRVRRICTPRR